MPTETNFVPEGLDCRDWANIEPFVNDLLARGLAGLEALQRWLLERSDLESYVYDTSSRLHVDMTCHTDDEAKQAAYRDFQQNVMPHVRQAIFALDRHYYASPARAKLDRERYGVLDRDTATDIELFRDENVPIETELNALRQEHSRITGAQAVEFEGQRRTLPAMVRYQEEPDRSVREVAWRVVAQRVGEDRPVLRDLFDRMVERRQRVARNAGFANYRDYIFPSKHRFDYTVADCEAYHDAVERIVVPMFRELGRQRAAALGVRDYRPWDTNVDVAGRPPLDPFGSDTDRMVEGGQRVFDEMDGELGRLYASLRDGESLDLKTREGKAPGGYQTTFAVSRRPFIFMNSAGLGRDFRTLLHEAGHAFHSFLGGNHPLLHYRHAPIEFCEVASMSMELTALPWLDGVYPSLDERQRAIRVQLEGIVRLLPWVAQIDAFQHWVYAHPGHSHEARAAAWRSLDERFGPGLDWSGLEEQRGESWQRQQHLFTSPFYYIEYGIAQLGALQVWLNYRSDPQRAIADYKAALALGGSRPLTELFECAGARFDFGAATIKRVMGEVERELATLPL